MRMAELKPFNLRSPFQTPSSSTTPFSPYSLLLFVLYNQVPVTGKLFACVMIQSYKLRRIETYGKFLI